MGMRERTEALIAAAAFIALVSPAYAAGPIDVCAIVTPADAAAVLGPLPAQPPSKTDNVGFGMTMCVYVGPAVSGEGAQTRLRRLTVQAGSGKDVPDLTEADVKKHKATAKLANVGDAATRNADGTFVWAKRGDVYCTAEIVNGAPRGQTADDTASKLGSLCRKVLAH
jgi:hypothetical protein